MARRRIVSPPPGAVSAGRAPTKNESDEENANTESQQILAIGSLLKKPRTDDKDMQQFKAKVAEDRKRLADLLDQRKREAQAAEARRRNEIATAIMTALETPNRPVQGDTPTYPGTKIAEHAVYKPVSTFLDASDALIAEFQRIDNMSREMQADAVTPVAEDFNAEIQEAERQLKLGARVALRNVVKVLGLPRDADADGDEEMLDVEDQQELSYDWQKSLQYAERGVKRMVKGLPDDDE